MLVAALLPLCRAEREHGERWEVAYGACFRSRLCPKGPFVRRSAAAQAVARRMMRTGTEISLLAGARLPCQQKLSRNQQFPPPSLSESGYHSAGAPERERSGAAHVRCFGLLDLAAKEKPLISR